MALRILTFLVSLCLLVIYIIKRRSQRSAQVQTHLVPLLQDCKKLTKWKTRDPLLGLDFIYENFRSLKDHSWLEVWAQRYEKTGLTYFVRLLGAYHLITTIEPANLKTVQALEFKSWGLGSERKQSMTPLLGEGIFTVDGEAWKWSRELLRPCFNRARIGAMEQFETHVQALLKRLREKKDGETVDLQPLFFELSMDIATEFLFGEKSDCLIGGVCSNSSLSENEKGEKSPKARRTQEFVEAFNYSLAALERQEEDSRGFVGMFLPNPKVKASNKIVHAYVDEIVERGLASHVDYLSGKTDYLFLQEIIKQTPEKVKIRSELLNILLAGRDTTASLLSNVFVELSRRPDIWNKLQQEVEDLSVEKLSFERLKDMKYLNAVLKESLRLYPVVPNNSREALEDTILPCGGGEDGQSPILVRKGWLLHWSLWAMHRRKDLFGEDAEEFKPERWLDQGEQKGLRVGWEYLPFNGGPRVCIGQQFALTETCYVIVRLMQEYGAIESRNSEPWKPKYGLTLTGFGGCKVALLPRSEPSSVSDTR